MTTHRVGTREEWRAERLELLEREKELTRLGDDLARRRRELPWVPVEKAYVFHTPQGERTLAELFEGRSQLLVYHFMFGPEWTEGCPGCSYFTDHVDGPLVHLHQHDVRLTLVSRAPLERLEAYRRRMGWTIPWVSSLGSEFNADYGVSFAQDGRNGGAEYNFAALDGDPADRPEELPGLSAFALDDGVVYHTYSTYGRGLDAMLGVNHLRDRAPHGRGDESGWPLRHDEYGRAPSGTAA